MRYAYVSTAKKYVSWQLCNNDSIHAKGIGDYLFYFDIFDIFLYTSPVKFYGLYTFYKSSQDILCCIGCLILACFRILVMTNTTSIR